MHNLYTEQDLSSLKKQLAKREAITFAVLALFVAGVIVTLVMDNHRENRPEMLTTLLVILAGVSFIFLWEMFVRPLLSYERHLEQALHGRTHEITVLFDHFGEEDSLIDRINYRDLYFLGEPDKHGERTRMFYWDLSRPLPSFRPGQEVTLSYFDRYIIGYRES